jgi:hypothetical protein
VANFHDRSAQLVTGIFGILFFVGIAVVLGLTASQPGPDASIADLRDSLVNDVGVTHVSNWLLAVSVVFIFLPFAAGLRSLLAKADTSGLWARAAYAGAAGVAAVTLLGSVFQASAMLVFQPGSFDDAFVRMIAYTDAYIFTVVVPSFIGLFLAANAIVVLRTGVFWKWIGWFGLLVTLLGLIGAAWPINGDPGGAVAVIGYLPIPLAALWSLAAGINVLRKPAVSPAE